MEATHPEPVEPRELLRRAVQDELYEINGPTAETADRILAAILDEGWQIMRTETIGYRADRRGGGPGEGTGWKVHIASGLHMSECCQVVAVVDEWTP